MKAKQPKPKLPPPNPDQVLPVVLVECRDQDEQARLMARLRNEGWTAVAAQQ